MRGFFGAVVRLYFRNIWTLGAIPKATARGTVFVANHPNGLVDPLLLLTQLPCQAAPLAKSTLWKVPGLAWLLNAAGAVPVFRKQDAAETGATDNDAMFRRVAEHLASGGNILLFPEGVSHDETRLLELRSGAARMLAKAWESGARELSFVPIALHFDAKDVFRSRALMIFGESEPASLFAGEQGIEVERLREAMRRSLADLLVDAPSRDEFDERILLAEMLSHESGKAAAQAAYQIAKARASSELCAAELRAYRRELDSWDLCDSDVFAMHRGSYRASLWPWQLLGIAGAVLFYLPYRLTGQLAKKKSDGRDTTSTYKLGLALLLFPFCWLLLIGAALSLLKWPMAMIASVLITLAPFAALDRLDDPARKLAPRSQHFGALWGLREGALSKIRQLQAGEDHHR